MVGPFMCQGVYFTKILIKPVAKLVVVGTNPTYVQPSMSVH